MYNNMKSIIDAVRHLFSHNWDKWQAPGEGDICKDEKKVGSFLKQERVCLYCGYTKIKYNTFYAGEKE